MSDASGPLGVGGDPDQLVAGAIGLIHDIAGADDDKVVRLAGAIEMVDVVVHAERNRRFDFFRNDHLRSVHADRLEADLDHGLDWFGGNPWRGAPAAMNSGLGTERVRGN